MVKSSVEARKPLDDARNGEFPSVQALRFQLALESRDEFELLTAIAAELAVIGDARRRIQLLLGRLPSVPNFDVNLHQLDSYRAYCLRAVRNALDALRTDRAIIADDLTATAAETGAAIPQPDGDPRFPIVDRPGAAPLERSYNEFTRQPRATVPALIGKTCEHCGHDLAKHSILDGSCDESLRGCKCPGYRGPGYATDEIVDCSPIAVTSCCICGQPAVGGAVAEAIDAATGARPTCSNPECIGAELEQRIAARRAAGRSPFTRRNQEL